jgi:hypothetical protein
MVEVTKTAPRRRSKPPAGLKPIEDDARLDSGDAFDADLTHDEANSPVSTVPRTEMRAQMRDEDHLARAKMRTAQIMGHLGDMDEGHDEFYVPKDIIPDGWTYEWKRRLLLGQEDPSYQVSLRRMGWDPVPAKRHPEMMPTNWHGETLERKGLILMERPTEIVDEARRIEYMKARKQVRDKEAQLSGAPDGQFTRDHAQTRPKINKSYESVPIPKE